MATLKLIDRNSSRPKMFDLELKHIKEIKNGKALTTTGRWYSIICECLEINNYEIVPDSEAPGGNGYIVCGICNKVHYLKDLKP